MFEQLVYHLIRSVKIESAACYIESGWCGMMGRDAQVALRLAGGSSLKACIDGLFDDRGLKGCQTPTLEL
jgi:hypothetical protein